MPITVTCEGCGKTLKVKEELAGKRGKCPACGALLTIPGGSAEDLEDSPYWQIPVAAPRGRRPRRRPSRGGRPRWLLPVCGGAAGVLFLVVVTVLSVVSTRQPEKDQFPVGAAPTRAGGMKTAPSGDEARVPRGAGMAEDRTGEKVLNVIFVGNSYTIYNDLPGMVARLLEADGVDLHTGSYLMLGSTLMEHWLHNLGQASKREEAMQRGERFGAWLGRFDRLLADGPWDYAVFQGNSGDTLMNWGFAEAATLWCDKLRNESPETKAVFFMTWARRHRPGQQATITNGYRSVARVNQALIAPAGEAWRAALDARPGLVLHAADKSHPTAAGTYLTACVFYATLTGKSPVDLSGRLSADGPRQSGRSLSDEDALFLQQVAWQAHLANQEAEAERRAIESGPEDPKTGPDLDMAPESTAAWP